MSSLYPLVVSFMFVNNVTFLERIERNTYFNDISMIFHAYPIIIMHLQVSMRIQNSVSDEVGETVHTTPESGAVKESFSFKTRMPSTVKCRPTVAY